MNKKPTTKPKPKANSATIPTKNIIPRKHNNIVVQRPTKKIPDSAIIDVSIDTIHNTENSKTIITDELVDAFMETIDNPKELGDFYNALHEYDLNKKNCINSIQPNYAIRLKDDFVFVSDDIIQTVQHYPTPDLPAFFSEESAVSIDKIDKPSTQANIVSLADRTLEEQRTIQFNGGKASGEARRMQRDARQILEMKPSIAAQEMLDAMAGKGHNMNISQAILYVQQNKAIVQQDTKAAEFVRDTSGNKPTDKLEVKADLSLTRMTEFYRNFERIEGYDEGEDDEY